MGGHGGLNILPQKRWNVYNFDNREKVRKDEEAAAREEQIKLEQSRRQDFEFRLQKLRQSRNIPDPQPPPPSSSPSSNPSTSNHINLFENSPDFAFLAADPDTKNKKPLKEEQVEKKRKREEKVVVTAEDEKYRLGYGLAGKGVKAPWYMQKSSAEFEEEKGKRDGGDEGKKKKSGGKKSIEELREERMRRERKEKEREREILRQGKGFSR